MKIWKTAIACSLTAAVVAGQVGQATAAPLPTQCRDHEGRGRR